MYIMKCNYIYIYIYITQMMDCPREMKIWSADMFFGNMIHDILVGY